eukprot:CAMPEP_0167748314 /NCGR_PEP_ID=MMETSP0110_2-20121227/4771_1 /TAXON_ID=629695 /ORGANISM="Gymnochlora sp., Strain CCMP2014" /LENGTH=482 /DNA_ID=CAMNT_0007633319 /DNA_START=108 /DNA_END=1556 /DNA_ORIENTATION=-
MDENVEVEVVKTRDDLFQEFDWKKQWYPIGWARDIPQNKPTKITLFDEDYVVAHGDKVKGGLICLKDACPHRLAALSEGRITPDGLVQCAYHGWAFDGQSGKTELIPQLPEGSEPDESACAQSVKIAEKMGLFWINPYDSSASEESIPVVNEMMNPDFKITPNVRDLPLDYSVLVENIMDPDHGLFAHQSVAFDMYSASKDHPQDVRVTKDDKGFLRVFARVNSTKKLTAKGDDDQSNAPYATQEFIPPSTIQICRRDPKTEETKFMTNFFLVPTRAGETRFLSCAVAKLPFAVPRTLSHIQLNNFLDQDTYLLATEQPHVLRNEAEAISNSQSLDRRKMYKYRSPAERLLLCVGRFLDISLPKMPNRYSNMVRMLDPCPPRTKVLDRYEQHTKICPDSMNFVARLQKFSKTMKLASFALIFATLGFENITTKISLGLWAITFYSMKWAADSLRAEFYFKHTEERRDVELERIDKVFTPKMS